LSANKQPDLQDFLLQRCVEAFEGAVAVAADIAAAAPPEPYTWGCLWR
jgi:hypothetical protein